MATDWLGRLGRRRFEALIDNVVEGSLDRMVRDSIEPRFAVLENRLAAIETRLDVAARIAGLDA